jgi:hypothetical protein
VSFRTHDDRRPSKFIVLTDNMKSAINKAWEHGRRGLPITLRQIHRTSRGYERGGAARSVNFNLLKVTWAQQRHLRVGILRRSLNDHRAASTSVGTLKQ